MLLKNHSWVKLYWYLTDFVILKINTKMSEKQFNETNFSELINEKISNTTIHGINNLRSTNNTLYRIFWIFCLVGSASICIVLIYLNVYDYCTYEVTTKIRYSSAKNILNAICFFLYFSKKNDSLNLRSQQ